MRIITSWWTEDDNGLLYVLSAQFKKEDGNEDKQFRHPIRVGCQSFFFFKHFLKRNKWIRMLGVFLLFFFHYYHQNFDINFWCSIFFKKATQLSFTFLAIMFFWSKIIFDENFDVIYFFSKNYTKVISFSAKQKVLWIRQSFNAASKTKNWSNPQQKIMNFCFLWSSHVNEYAKSKNSIMIHF